MRVGVGEEQAGAWVCGLRGWGLFCTFRGIVVGGGLRSPHVGGRGKGEDGGGCSQGTTRVPQRDHVARKSVPVKPGAAPGRVRWRPHPAAGLEGAAGGRGEEMKVPGGPQTGAAAGMRPPAPPQPRSSAQPGPGSLGAPRVCGALPLWPLLASLCVSCSGRGFGLSEFPSLPLRPYLVCTTLGFVCDRGLCEVQLLLQ